MILLFILIIITAFILSYHFLKDIFVEEKVQLASAIVISTIFSSAAILLIFYSKLIIGPQMLLIWISIGIITIIVIPISFNRKTHDENIFNGVVKVLKILVIIFGTVPLVTTIFQDLNIILQTLIYLSIVALCFLISIKLFGSKIVAKTPELYIRKISIKIGILTIVLVGFGFLLNADFASDLRTAANLDNYIGPVFKDSKASNMGYKESAVFSLTMEDIDVYDFYQTDKYLYIQTSTEITKYDLQYNIVSTSPSVITTSTTTITNDDTSGRLNVESTTYTRPYSVDQNTGTIIITKTSEGLITTKQIGIKPDNYKVFSLSEKEVKYLQYILDDNDTISLHMKFLSNIMKEDIFNSFKIIGTDFNNQYIKTYENGTLTITELKPVDNYRYMYLTEIFYTYMIFAHIIILVVPYNTFESQTFILDSSKKIY
jgi:hypothetical protein